MRAKNKSLMRRRLAEAHTEHVAATRIGAAGHPPDGLRYPVVLKPAEGVASEDVVLVSCPEELAEQSARILARRPGETLLAEEYLPGELRTLGPRPHRTRRGNTCSRRWARSASRSARATPSTSTAARGRRPHRHHPYQP
jgi:hypothetical protein